MSISEPQQLTAVILAGGQGQRVGYQQKALLPYQGAPIIKPILRQLKSQVQHVWINANTELERYQAFSKNVFSDQYQGFLGPLAGMHATWHYIETEWAVFVPCDNPNIPTDFVDRLLKAYKQQPNPIIAVFDGERLQPLYLMMHCSMKESLGRAIEIGHLSVNRWVKENPYTSADFADCGSESFQNMNTLERFDSQQSC